MTISSSTRKAGPFTGNGTATTFPFTFKVFQASDLLVVRLNTSTFVESTLVLNTDYTVSLNQNQNTNPGGSIVLGADLATGFTLTATSDIQNLQPTDLTNQGGFYPTVINDALDRATIQIQQIQEEVDRSLKYPISDPVTGAVLPPVGARATTVLAFDENGEPVAGPSVADVRTVLENLTNIATVADDIANVDTVATNIGDVNTVAGDIANINAVAGDLANIDAVKADLANIDVVANNVVDVNNFADVYQGAKSADPTLRNNGSALHAGDMYFNTAVNEIRIYSGTVWVAGTAGTMAVQRFDGTGSATVFTLATAPAGENNTQIYINGVYQQKDTYTVSGTTLTFDAAPPSGTSNIEVVTISTLALGQTDASLVSFLQAGAGAVQRTVQTKLREIPSLADFGPDLTGSTSANSAIAAAQAASPYLIASAGTYRITSNLTITSALTMVKGAMFSVDSGVTLTINGPFDAGLYQVFTGSGTVVFGGGASVIEEFPEWRGVLPVVTCYGDSFTMGVSGGITYDQSYVALIAKAKNWSIPTPADRSNPGVPSTHVGNQAFGGSQISSTEQINRIMAHTTTDTDIQFILTGFNDMRAFGNIASGVITYRQTLQAALAWMSIPASSTEKLFANSSDTSRVVRTGAGWTANASWFNGQGYHTAVQNNTFGFTVFGDTIYMALPRDTFTTGTCSITVDGVNYGTYDYSGSSAAIQYTKTYNMGFVRISGLSRGSHAVVLTKTSANTGTDFMRVDWVAGVDGLQSAQGVMGGPQVFVGNCCRMITAEYTDPRHGGYINGSDAVVAGYNTMIEQCVRELASDGLNITYVDATKYFDPNSPDLNADLVHPSVTGMQKIANAFLERMDERKVHPKDRGTVDTGQKYINEQWTSTSLGTVVAFGDESKPSMFGLGGINTMLSHNVKLVDGKYFRINDLKAAWQITLGDATSGPALLYRAAGTGQITSWDKTLYLDGSYQPWLTPTLLNSWVNASGSWTPARYLKDANGFVHLGGLIGSGVIAAAAFVLPAGFRPSGKVGFPIVANGAFGWVTVLADGTVTVEGGSNVWASLEGITFRAV